MSSDALPDVARGLIEQHIDSVGRLDLLLILYGDPRERWSAERMSRQMRAPLKWTTGEMRALQKARILSCESAGGEPTWAYSPGDEQIGDAVQALVSACRMDWPNVIREVMKTRPSGAQAFSDAFRLRKPNG